MVMEQFSLEGRVAVVTGGSRGIGRAVAIALAEAGADVAIGARKPESLDEAAAAIRATGRRALPVATNVRDTDALQALVDETRRELGRIDILVNNAGTNPVFAGIADLEERAWDAVMNTNVRAAFLLSRMARAAMVEQGDGGAIVNVASMTGIRPSPGLGAYSISKSALIMLTKVCAAEWGSDGIRVNCIAPGVIRTDFSRALWEDDANLRRTLDRAALGRIGEVAEVPAAVVYLASGAASYVTGETLVMDGGETV